MDDLQVSDASARQTIEKASELDHAGVEVLQPLRRAPDLDTYRGPDNNHFAAGLNPEKLAESFGHQ
jgi:hypothetical protein